MNELRKKYKEETKQPITEKPTGNFDYFKDEYVFWLEEHLSAINYTRCCTEFSCYLEDSEQGSRCKEQCSDCKEYKGECN
jgi:hypothetical protein